jgi:hypothetical protein
VTVGTTWLLRNATTTNTVGHSYQYLTAPTPDEEAFGFVRYFQRFDMTAWDETNSTTLQGVTADGSITMTVTIIAGDVTPQNPP